MMTAQNSPAFLDIPPLTSAQGVVRLPGSKSISNRVLLLAALSEGTTHITGLLQAQDTEVMQKALSQLGCGLTWNETGVLSLTGLGGQAAALQQTQEGKTGTGSTEYVQGKEGIGRWGSPDQPLTLFLGNAGTAMRPLCAALALLGGYFELSGTARMHERPIADLVNALRSLGCQIDYLGQEGYPPLRIAPCQPNPGIENAIKPSGQIPPKEVLGIEQQTGQVSQKTDTPVTLQVRGDVSSQFLTALLMALPLRSQQGQSIVIEVVGPLISQPYIAMTVRLMAQFGVAVAQENWQRFSIPAGSCYRSPGQFLVEADASSASYFIALGAVACTNGLLRIEGVGLDSIQGDIHFVEAARQMGAAIEGGSDFLQVRRGQWPLKAIDMDCQNIPDAAMTLAVMALYADGPSTLRGIASWRIKETDRIHAMHTELTKFGAQVESGADFLRIKPPVSLSDWKGASVATYDDHRMAMALSLAAFNPAGLPLRIQDPACVAKTFPNYFELFFQAVSTLPENIPVICIDGPSASGKGTLARCLAQALGYHCLDSGLLYRALALAAQNEGVALDDEEALSALALNLALRFEDKEDKEACVYLAGQEVSSTLRSEAIGKAASQVSAWPGVRQALVQKQRQFQKLPGLVADGRDMGTTIFPHSPLKIFLTASLDCRANRRYLQLQESPPKSCEEKRVNSYAGDDVSSACITLEHVRAELAARDWADTQRPNAPLKSAPDAVVLDNSGLSVAQSVGLILQAWQGKQPFSLSSMGAMA